MDRGSEKVLRQAVEHVCSNPDNYASEGQFQKALATCLGDASRELAMMFDPPAIRPKTPTPEDIAYCTERGRKLSPSGKDPCDGKDRRLDILWNNIPIELKSVVKVKVDFCGYHFLKDIHRLERLSGVVGGTPLSATRFSIYVSSDEELWQRKWSNAPDIREGRMIEPGHWVQYEQKSARTRWIDYPPFFLAGRYELHWSPLPNGAKYLLVKVEKQASKPS